MVWRRVNQWILSKLWRRMKKDIPFTCRIRECVPDRFAGWGEVIEVNGKKNHPSLMLQSYVSECSKCQRRVTYYQEMTREEIRSLRKTVDVG